MQRILLIDDETEICFLLSNVIKRAGGQCDMAHSLADGRKLLGKADYGAVFLDIHLPDGLGYDLIPEIRTHHPAARVIAISAVDNERLTATAKGADLFIPKPFDKLSILQGLRQLGVPVNTHS